MRKQILISLLPLIWLGSCMQKNYDQANAAEQFQDSAALPAAKRVSIPFDKDRRFEIVDLTYRISSQSSSTDTVRCKDWKVEPQDVERILQDAEVISGEDWHHRFDVLPCEARGKIVQEGRNYDFEMNAGAWFTVIFSDTTIKLGNFRKEHEQYFLSGAWTVEE